MENVYFYKYNIGKDVEKALKEKIEIKEDGSTEKHTDDLISHIDYTTRDCKLISPNRKGYFLYVKADQDQIDYIEKKLEGLDIQKLDGTEKENIVKAINAEEDNAASGMGMIFNI